MLCLCCVQYDNVEIQRLLSDPQVFDAIQRIQLSGQDDRQTNAGSEIEFVPELSMGWVDPWAGLGWVGNGSRIFVFSGLGWVVGLK